MRFSTILSGVATIASFAFAQTGPNPFKIPVQGYLVTAGQPTTFNWTPTTSGTVSLQLKDGPNGDLNTVETIAANITNSGTYTWTPASTTVENNSYAIEIIDDADPSQVNYTPQFDIISTVHATPTASNSTITATGSTTLATISSSGSAVSTSTGTVTSSSSAATTTAATSASASAQSTTAPTGNSGSAVRAGGALLAVALAAFAVL
ncbi:MAG: hypothetical protein MMC33_001857 [Icmadophila ericetorum]|nr:hypothetical protein [Icmadophila ericetorum]